MKMCSWVQKWIKLLDFNDIESECHTSRDREPSNAGTNVYLNNKDLINNDESFHLEPGDTRIFTLS